MYQLHGDFKEAHASEKMCDLQRLESILVVDSLLLQQMTAAEVDTLSGLYFF